MANNTTNDRYWLLDTAAEIIAVGTQIRVQRLVLEPAAQNDAATIQEYVSGSLAQAAYLKELKAAIDFNQLDFSGEGGGRGRVFNGFKLSAITAGAKLHVYLSPS
ncbi:MAG TPA: hypothetical protein VFI02_03650 [Armatimonadota bacterium]|nr:hypothetical protein [Armatimonadota bacterium]